MNRSAKGTKNEEIKVTVYKNYQNNEDDVLIVVYRDGRVPEMTELSVNQAVILFNSLADVILEANDFNRNNL
jgi:hypothetical protein